jgi:hypothetical protein
MNTRTLLLNLAPPAGRGRIALAIRVRGYRSIDRSHSLREPLTPTLSPQARGEGVQLPSPGKSAKRVFTVTTGRPSTPRLLGLNSGFPAYWIPAFAGMTRGGAGMASWAWCDQETQTQC